MSSETDTKSFAYLVEKQALLSPRSRSARLHYENSVLKYENYKKDFLPMIGLSVNPISFNRSLRLLQDPQKGEYHSVEDYVNTSVATLTLSQRIGPLGGILTASSGLSYLREFTGSRNNFSSTPFSLSYSQGLRGGYKDYIIERSINRLQYKVAVKTLCTALANEQQDVARLYLKAYMAQVEKEQAEQDVSASDTLLAFGQLRRKLGYVTDYELNVIRLERFEAEQALVASQTELNDALFLLRSRLGLVELDVNVVKPDAAALPLLLDENEVYAVAQANTPKVLALELQRQQVLQTLRKQRLSTRLGGELSINYGLNQFAHTFSNAYRHPNHRQSISLTLSIPSFDWGISRNRRRMAENDYQQAQIGINESLLKAEQEIHKSIKVYNQSSASYRLGLKQYALAQEQYRLAMLRFSQGEFSLAEVIDAHKSLRESLKNMLSALQSLFSEYYQLRTITLYDFVKKKNLEEEYL